MRRFTPIWIALCAAFSLAVLSLSACAPEISVAEPVEAPVETGLQLTETATPNTAPVTRPESLPELRGGFPLVTSEQAVETAVTIYPDNLALITEVRRVNVPEGTSVIAFEGVSDLIIPQSLVLREFTGLTLERNFDYDLLGKTALFETSVGKTMRLTRIDPASGNVTVSDAEVVSARRDTGVLMRIDGKIEALSCSGLGARTQFKGLPEDLTGKPVMSVQVRAEEAGEQELVISYLTSGLGWRADYRVDMTSGETASMLGWLTLTNGTAKDYKDVPLAIIAGDLNRRPETRAISPPKPSLRAQCYPKGSTKTGTYAAMSALRSDVYGDGSFGADRLYAPSPVMAEMAPMDMAMGANARKMAQQEDVGDYKLYRIPGLANVKPYQTKQIAFIDEGEIEVDQFYKINLSGYEQAGHWRALSTAFDVDNSRDGMLAKPLPKGTARIFQKQSNDRVVYLGEDRIDNLPVDEDAKLTIGTSQNIMMRVDKGFRRNNWTSGPIKLAYTFTNATDQAQDIEVTFTNRKVGNKDISGESHPRDTDEIDPIWRITIQPESAEVLSFAVNTEM